MKGTSKQRLAFKHLTNGSTKTVVYGGAAGGGKSFLGCFWLVSMAMAYPGTRYYIGREELKRIRQSTLISWHKLCKHIGFTDYKTNFQDNYIRLGNGSQIDLLDLKYLPSDPLYERFGSIEYTAGWIEEAGEVNFGAYDVLKTRTGRHMNDEYGIKPKNFVTCNPKKNWLYSEIYKPSKANTLPDDTVFIQAFVQDNPYLTEDYIDNLRNTKDKAKKERLFYGNWEYDDDPASLIDIDSINDYFTNEHVLADGLKYITADIARKGKDKTVVRVWHGWRVIDRKEMAVSRVTESADLIKSLALDHGIPMSRVVADEDGVGGGVVDILRCKGFVNNSTAVKVKGQKENYKNLKSQCSFRMAKRIVDKEVYEVCNSTDVKTVVTEEMEQVKQKDIDKDVPLSVIPKEKVKEMIGRSPDEWDSIMMREFFELKKTSLLAFSG